MSLPESPTSQNNLSRRDLLKTAALWTAAAALNPIFKRVDTLKGVETEMTPNEHPFKLYIDPILVPDIQFAKDNIPKYVADMNFILAKNTNRHFNFNSGTGIILTTVKPQTDSCPGDSPGEGYEVWAHVQPTENQVSYGGYGSCDMSGAGVLGNLHWTRIYNPDELIPNSQQTYDYWIQIDHMLHEFGHVCSVGLGEYYNLGRVIDATGIEPLLNISLLDPNDAFWSDKKDFYPDPMLRIAYDNPLIGRPKNRNDLLAGTKFGDLSAAIINGNFRHFPTLDYSNLQLQIVDKRTGMPIPDVNIKMWKVRGTSGNLATPLGDFVSDPTGKFLFDWGTPGNPHNNYDFLRLVKIYRDGYKPFAKYISIFDVDIQLFLQDKDTFSATMAMEPELYQSFLPSIFKSEPVSDE